MGHTDKDKVAPPPEIDSGIDYAPIEARLTAIVAGGELRPGRDLIAVMDRYAFPQVLRVKILLFTATAAAACVCGRITSERVLELHRDEMRDALRESADGRMIDRHRYLLLHLVVRGCERRGELPAPAAEMPGSAAGEEAAHASA